MVGQDDEALATKISIQANHYEKKRACFGKALAISSQGKMSPLDWWDAYGGDATELQHFAKRLLGLCASSSGCERNWSTFEFMHIKRRNRLEHQRLNDLVYIKYNKKIAERFQKMRVEGSNFNPLIFGEYEWNTNWMMQVLKMSMRQSRKIWIGHLLMRLWVHQVCSVVTIYLGKPMPQVLGLGALYCIIINDAMVVLQVQAQGQLKRKEAGEVTSLMKILGWMMKRLRMTTANLLLLLLMTMHKVEL